ncbi:hypothetical protein [Paraburkholderia nodosa]|uniref:hypothetical protein n=1 Tax=Paraburkholderia nodosa TaxID=392320 RepID=UPI00114CEC15|nr:hypothetical protein [Paraburkholderia nodosa]
MATLHPGLPELNLPSRQGGSPSVSSWLLSYPMFRDALQREETDFVALPSYETLCSIFPAARVPLVARPPCLLSPGVGFFLEGWARFLAYWSRNDRTIPLLAVDWQALYGRLTDDPPNGAKAAAKIRPSLFCMA